ncbi:MAG: lysophospholipase [Gammaproteobacteria bacterium]|nr:lysophospholipase [Gammaproteobacteria bacterium]
MKNFKSLDVSFLNDRGINIAARLELPDKARHFAIFSPCFTCTKETLASYRISQSLANKNMAVLRIDFTGLGESGGEFADSNFSTMISDIVAANEFLKQHYSEASLLLGHSMGGTASYAAAALLKKTRAIVSIASPSSPQHVMHHFGQALADLNAGIQSEFYVAGKAYAIKPQFLEDLKQHKLEQIISALDKAVLVFHGENDKLVSIQHAETIFAHASQPKSFISLDTADHVLSAREDAEYVASLIYHWSQRYLTNS